MAKELFGSWVVPQQNKPLMDQIFTFVVHRTTTVFDRLHFMVSAEKKKPPNFFPCQTKAPGSTLKKN